MTLAEVEDMLGGPARDESTGELLAHLTAEDIELVKRIGPPLTNEKLARLGTIGVFLGKTWQNDNALISIAFDSDGKVRTHKFVAVYRQFDPWGNLRTWLKV